MKLRKPRLDYLSGNATRLAKIYQVETWHTPKTHLHYTTNTSLL